MSMIERIRRGKELIVRGRSCGKDVEALEAEVKYLQSYLEVQVKRLKLSEFEKRDLAVEIYSEVLGCNLRLCSNENMAAHVKQDDPGTVCYMVNELRIIILRNPPQETLKRIHTAKSVFPDSTLKDIESNHDSEEKNGEQGRGRSR